MFLLIFYGSIRFPYLLSNCTIMHPLVNIALAAAKDAATIIHKYRSQLDRINITERNKNEFITDAHIKAEQVIINHIYKAYPKHTILAQNAGFIKNEDETTWMIGAICGTRNFIHGYPKYVISIAVKQNNRIEHGVIYNPITLDIYSASRGQGARFNDQRTRVSKEAKISQALIATSINCQDPAFTTNQFNSLSKISLECSGMHVTGSPALDLAHVATGQLNGAYLMGVKQWQVAAGILLIKESGGLVCDTEGKENYLKNESVIAGSPKILKSLLKHAH